MKKFSAIFLIYCIFLFSCNNQANPNLENHQQRILAEGKTWLRLHTKSPGLLLKRMHQENIDITGSHHRLGFVDIYIEASKMNDILEKHGKYIQRAESIDHLKTTRALSDYHDPQEVSIFLDQIAVTYPNIAQKVTLVEGLFDGHAIYAMKISDNVEIDEDEPTFLMDMQTHAREVMTTEVGLDAIEHLTSNYGFDPNITNWINNLEIWIVPVVNPSGAAYVFTTDSMWRTNRQADCEYGVDINRNFSWNYRQCSGSDDYCGSEVYHGTGPASELETQTMEALMAELRPMFYINYHSYGEYILWSSGCGLVDNHETLAYYANQLNNRVENDDGQVGQWTIGNSAEALYSAPGAADDHAFGAIGAISFTFELNSYDFQPDYDTYRDVTVERQRAAWQYLLDQTLNGPTIQGNVYDASILEPTSCDIEIASSTFLSGQWPLTTDARGRFGRAVMPNSEHLLVFTKQGFIPQVLNIQVGTSPSYFEVYLVPGTNQNAPVAICGEDITAIEGDTVYLDATASYDLDGGQLYFRWTQTAGPAVELSAGYTDQPHFFAGSVDADTILTFEAIALDAMSTIKPALLNLATHL
jgi:hypothetical protein